MIQDPVNIEGVDYKFADLPPLAQKMLTYITQIDNQLDSAASQVELLQVTREGVYTKLLKAMEKPNV